MFVQHSPETCPCCGSDNVDITTPQSRSGEVSLPLFCHACDAEWDIVYARDNDTNTLTRAMKIEIINDSDCVRQLHALLPRTT